MGKIYADRAFIEINGTELAGAENVDLNVNENLTRVDTMTRTKRAAGYRKGNLVVNGSFTLAVESDRPQVNLALKDPSLTANLAFIMGGERFSVIDVEQAEMSHSGTVGNATKTIRFEALDIVDDTGRSRASEFGLS